MAISISGDGWDRPLLDYSSKCADPICFLSWCYYRVITPLDPSKFDNCQSKIAEIALRVFIVLGALVSLASIVVPVTLIVLGIASRILRAVGFALQKDNHTHVHGLAPEKMLNHEAKVMTWNVCGIGGGLHYDHGGVIDWRSRLDGFVQKIGVEDPDVLVLQEIYDTALAEALIEKLKETYAHFFIHLGANAMGSVGGVMVLSKCAVYSFSNPSFTNNDWTLNRTFANLEIKASPLDNAPCARIIGTHLIHNDNNARIAQVGQILESLQGKAPIPTLLMGDLNLERDLPEQGGILNPHFEHGYQGNAPTRTNQMLKEWDPKLVDPGDFIDYISRYWNYGGQLLDTHLVPAYDPDFNTQTALSDHNGLSAKLVW